MSRVRTVRSVETGLAAGGKVIEAWVQSFPKDEDVLILTGAAIRVDRIPDLIAMLQDIHDTEKGTPAA
jgi:hypothetical protein